MAKPLRWYRIPRNYRVEDEVYVLATSAEEARAQHWEGFGGIGYAFSDESRVWATEPDLIEDGEIRMSRTRMVAVADVPAWMVNQAVVLKHLPPAEREAVKDGIARWNTPSEFGIPRQREDAPLAVYLPS